MRWVLTALTLALVCLTATAQVCPTCPGGVEAGGLSAPQYGFGGGYGYAPQYAPQSYGGFAPAYGGMPQSFAAPPPVQYGSCNGGGFSYGGYGSYAGFSAPQYSAPPPVFFSPPPAYGGYSAYGGYPGPIYGGFRERIPRVLEVRAPFVRLGVGPRVFRRY
jgi:hypothetical protein